MPVVHNTYNTLAFFTAGESDRPVHQTVQIQTTSKPHSKAKTENTRTQDTKSGRSSSIASTCYTKHATPHAAEHAALRGDLHCSSSANTKHRAAETAC
jgi:hypothetical protein